MTATYTAGDIRTACQLMAWLMELTRPQLKPLSKLAGSLDSYAAKKKGMALIVVGRLIATPGGLDGSRIIIAQDKPVIDIARELAAFLKATTK